MMRKHKGRKAKPTKSYSVPSPQKIKTILQDLPSNLSFHFYEEMDKPTGQIATSLLDFCDKLASAHSPEAQASLNFHTRRGDFATWIKESIGDSDLADKISKIKPNDQNLVEKLHQTVDNRIKQLKDSMIEYSIVPEDSQVMMHVELAH